MDPKGFTLILTKKEIRLGLEKPDVTRNLLKLWVRYLGIFRITF